MSETFLTVSLPISLTWTDYPDPNNCAVIIYFTGCKHNCPGCQNPELQKFNGTKFTPTELYNLVIEEAGKAQTNKVVLSGGDAFFQDKATLDLFLTLLHNDGYEICFYTGCSDIASLEVEFSPLVTYYKCGKYDERNKESEWGKFSDRMVFVSKNQRLYNFEGELISVGNVYYFSKWDTFKAKIKRFLKRVLNRESV